jgi:hypothetical protein
MEFSASVGFIDKEAVTMRGHKIVKKKLDKVLQGIKISQSNNVRILQKEILHEKVW